MENQKEFLHEHHESMFACNEYKNNYYKNVGRRIYILMLVG